MLLKSLISPVEMSKQMDHHATRYLNVIGNKPLENKK